MVLFCTLHFNFIGLYNLYKLNKKIGQVCLKNLLYY